MHTELLSTRRLLAGAVVFLLVSLLILATVAEPYYKIRYDFIVIGGGAEGYIVAKRLTENPHWKVLIIEPGNYWSASDFYSVERTNKTLAHRIRWPRLSDERIRKQYVRGVPQDYDLWLEKGNHGWGWDDLLPYFEKSVGEAGSAFMPESYVVLNESMPINQDLEDVERMVLSETARSKSLRLLHTAETGICNLPYTEVRNSDAINKRPNLHMIKNAEPKRINFDASKERVKSVTVMYNYRELTVEFNKELVLAAGAIDSAKILMLSGVGIKEHLNSLNIRVLHDLPVGQNLQDHLTLPLFFTTPILNLQYPPLEETTKNFTEEIPERLQPFGDQGMLSLTEFVNTIPRSHSNTPDIEYHYYFIKHQDLATLRNWNSIAVLDWRFYNNLESTLLTKNLLIIQAVLVHPKSTGSVELRSANCVDNPKILANYLDNPEDVETLLRGIHHVKNKLKGDSFENVKLLKIPIPECYKNPLEDDFYWRCYMKYMAMPQVNHVGTVKMGTNPNESCVNSRLLVHGVKNLRVADASIMPDIPSSEIHAATMMIAEKAVDLIRMDCKCK